MSNPNHITDRERAALSALQAIVMEAMQYPLQRPISSDSHLPESLITMAQTALGMYGLQLFDNQPAAKVAA